MLKTALISGVTGQDGAYLAQHLLDAGYRVIAFHQRGRDFKPDNLLYLGINEQIQVWEGCLSTISDWCSVIEEFSPDEIYGLAGQSLVWASWNDPIATLRLNIESVSAVLEAVRITGGRSRAFVALSSEVFGAPCNLPITEKTPFAPTTPYSISKVADYWLVRAYRERYGLLASCGFLFNHESILRPNNFVVKKIINTAFDIASGAAEELVLGNVDISRDFGYAPEYVVAMHKILSADMPDDYVLATGASISIREFVNEVFRELQIPDSCMRVDPHLIRKGEVMKTWGIADKAKTKLDWEPIFKGRALISKLVADYRTQLAMRGGA